MVKRALCVGCNYPTKAFGLAGAVNDAFLIAECLQKNCGFDPANVCVLHDIYPGQKKSVKVDPEKQPTRVNILQRLQWLVRCSQPGDVLFFSFSGYGLQVDDVDGYQDEGYDEAILPTDFIDGRDGDYTVIVTGDIHDILLGIPPECHATVLMDCDHGTSVIDVSGTLDGQLVRGLKYTDFCGLKAHSGKMTLANHNRDVWQEDHARAVKARPRFQPSMEIDNPRRGRLPTRPAMSRSTPVAFCYSAAHHGQTAMELLVRRSEGDAQKHHGVLTWCFVLGLEELDYSCTHLHLMEAIRRNFHRIKERDLPHMDQEALLTFSTPLSNPSRMKVLQPIDASQLSGASAASPSRAIATPAVVPPPRPGEVGNSPLPAGGGYRNGRTPPDAGAMGGYPRTPSSVAGGGQRNPLLQPGSPETPPHTEGRQPWPPQTKAPMPERPSPEPPPKFAGATPPSDSWFVGPQTPVQTRGRGPDRQSFGPPSGGGAGLGDRNDAPARPDSRPPSPPHPDGQQRGLPPPPPPPPPGGRSTPPLPPPPPQLPLGRTPPGPERQPDAGHGGNFFDGLLRGSPRSAQRALFDENSLLGQTALALQGRRNVDRMTSAQFDDLSACGMPRSGASQAVLTAPRTPQPETKAVQRLFTDLGGSARNVAQAAPPVAPAGASLSWFGNMDAYIPTQQQVQLGAPSLRPQQQQQRRQQQQQQLPPPPPPMPGLRPPAAIIDVALLDASTRSHPAAASGGSPPPSNWSVGLGASPRHSLGGAQRPPAGRRLS